MDLMLLFARSGLTLGMLTCLSTLPSCGDDTDSSGTTPLDAGNHADASQETSGDGGSHPGSGSNDAGTGGGADGAVPEAHDSGQDADASTDTSAGAGPCSIAFSANTSNMVDATKSITTECSAAKFGDPGGPSQVNFGAQDMVDAFTRVFTIDWFDARRTAGTEIEVVGGFDFNVSRGVHVSYMEIGASATLWVANTGQVSLESVVGNIYVVKLHNVHFAPDNSGPTPGSATGDFVVNGTITGTLK